MQRKHFAIIASAMVAAVIIAALVFLRSAPAPTTEPVIPRDTSHDDLIRVDAPQQDDEVASPLVVTGQARGQWYFEASFPVTLLDANGQVVVAHYAQADGEWMTEEFSPFTATLMFERPATKTGTLVLMKSNASGLPENDDEVRIPVRFASEQPGKDMPACIRSGCSGQICSDQEMASDCMFRPEYACYRSAECARQASGECGWTITPELTSCLQSPPTE